MTVKRVAKKPKYKVGQVVVRTYFGTYWKVDNVGHDWVRFGSGKEAQYVCNSDVRPLTKREKG